MWMPLRSQRKAVVPIPTCLTLILPFKLMEISEARLASLKCYYRAMLKRFIFYLLFRATGVRVPLKDFVQEEGLYWISNGKTMH